MGRGRGRPRHQPTDETRNMVRMMVVAGIQFEAVARCLGISSDTLCKYYQEELETSKPKAIAAVSGSLYNKAISKSHPQSVTAAIFFLKTQGGWKDVNHHEMAGPNGAPIPHEHAHKVDVSGLNEDELEFVRAILVRRSQEPD